MKTLKIEIPKGFEIDNFDIKTGEIKFKETPKCVTERIKTIDDVLSANDITRQAFDKWCNGLEVDEINYRLVKLIVLALNEGWKPDWKNSNEYKYFPYFDMDDSSSGSRFSYLVYDYWLSSSSVGSRLCFKTSKLAKYAGKQFTEVYKKFMIIN